MKWLRRRHEVFYFILFTQLQRCKYNVYVEFQANRQQRHCESLWAVYYPTIHIRHHMNSMSASTFFTANSLVKGIGWMIASLTRCKTKILSSQLNILVSLIVLLISRILISFSVANYCFITSVSIQLPLHRFITICPTLTPQLAFRVQLIYFRIVLWNMQVRWRKKKSLAS